MLIADRQFLLLIEVPIQDRAQQFQIYEVFHLTVPHGDVSPQYKFNNKYMGVTYYEHNHAYPAAVLNMPSCKWTVLQNKCTIPSSQKSTFMYSSLIYQE